MLKHVVGITGTIAAGRGNVKEILMKKFPCYQVKISDIIRAEFERKKQTFNRTTLQEMGNDMRKTYGPHIFALLAIEYLPRDKDMIIIEGIRNPGEINYLKKNFGEKFFLIGVDAPQQIRFERIKENGKYNDPKVFEEFVVLDEREQGKDEPEWGLQVRKCIEQANFVIMNDGTLDQLTEKVNSFLNLSNTTHDQQ
jgi:dephospho-CoA kinase